jgi:hypothetical protein
MNRTVLTATADLLTCGGLSLAQPPGITPETINRSLSLEGPPLAIPGAKLPAKGGARQANAAGLHAAIDLAGSENARTDSPLKGKIVLDKVAVLGQSCGGILSLDLGTDPRVKTIGVFNSGVQKPRSPYLAADALPKLHGPVLLINSGEPDSRKPTPCSSGITAISARIRTRTRSRKASSQ